MFANLKRTINLINSIMLSTESLYDFNENFEFKKENVEYVEEIS